VSIAAAFGWRFPRLRVAAFVTGECRRNSSTEGTEHAKVRAFFGLVLKDLAPHSPLRRSAANAVMKLWLEARGWGLEDRSEKPEAGN
jgi:hypothetical protein